MNISEPGCIGNTILTASGLYFDFNHPHTHQVTIGDIAKSLGNTCRFAGHVDFYSVAEHCVYCANVAAQVDPGNVDLAYHALMHDAAEAYIGDIPKPLKVMMPEFQAIETIVERTIAKKFRLEDRFHQAVKRIDLQLLKAEKKQLFPDDRMIWTEFENIDDVEIDFQLLGPKEASTRFLEKLFTLDAIYQHNRLME